MSYSASDAAFFPLASGYLAAQQTLYGTNLLANIRSNMDSQQQANNSSATFNLADFPGAPLTQDPDLTATLQQLGYLVTFSGSTYTIDWTAPTA